MEYDLSNLVCYYAVFHCVSYIFSNNNNPYLAHLFPSLHLYTLMMDERIFRTLHTVLMVWENLLNLQNMLT